MEQFAIHRTVQSLKQLHQTARRTFLDAAHSGNLELMRWLWSLGLVAYGDCEGDQEGWTALLNAARNGHTHVAQFLLERGASTASRTPQAFMPIHFAAASGNVEMADLLCRFGADVNASGKNGRTALHFALEKRFTRVMTFLLLHPSIDVLKPNASGETVLWRACATGDMAAVVQIVEQLDRAGATGTKRALVNIARRDNSTPLLMASARGDLDLVVYLIAHGAELERKDANGCTPLYAATRKNHTGVAELLLASGADTETTDGGGSTPLIFASKEGFEHLVGLLLEHGVTINHRNVEGYSALHAAAFEGYAAIVQSLLTRDADPEVRTYKKGWTPLLHAAEYGHVKVVRLLIDHGADVNCQGYDNWTPLIIAAWKGNTTVCALLLERGASTTLLARDGQTALHVAAFSDHREILRLLLAAGADRNAQDVYGRTAAYMAMMEGNFATAELVRETGSDETEYDNDIWPRQSLRELYGVANTTNQDAKTPGQNPPWYIGRLSITSVELCPHLTTPAAHISVGTWLGSRVVIAETAIPFNQQPGVNTTIRKIFRGEVQKLYPLRHPHVIRLYGACHRGETPFLVMEHAQNGTLRSFVGEHRHRTWAILHQVALGVQYLHERGLVHRRLKGDHIQIGDDGLVKLSALGVFSGGLFGESSLEWDAPEVTYHQAVFAENDVYSLGMCIIEAVSGQTPYAHEAAANQDIGELIKRGVPPTMPAAISSEGWELVMQMICFEPHKRLKMPDVVRELAALAQDEALQLRSLAINDISLLVNSHGVEESFALTRTLIRDNGNEVSENGPDKVTPQSQVYHRLHAVWEASESLPTSCHQLVLPRILNILTRFTNDLQAHASMSVAASFAAQRQHADRVYSFHNEIDRLLERHGELLSTHAASTSTSDIHSWRGQWNVHRHKQLQTLGASLERVDELDVEACTCLLRELTKRNNAYASIPPLVIQEACSKLRSMPGVRVPDWFIPHYEVVFDAFKSFSRGAFGSVHRGEWMGSLAVIKKVFADDESEFQKEVEIWSRLYHPHVLQLFGACHVGQQFIVSEFAEHGQLDHYLRRLEKQPAKREREVWRTLHEAALGLQYLHSRGVVHCDLKCNNILIGRDGKAKVSDYGLSRMRQQQLEGVFDKSNQHGSAVYELTGVGAPRWKAPEVLNGAEPSIESDVYSFGMCVVEAVSGEYPWGLRHDELVSDHVRRGGALFSKPRGFGEAQWALVVGACRFEPADRLVLAEIVAQLEAFARNDPELEDGTENDALSKLEELSEPDSFDSPSSGLSDEGSCSRNASYSDSW